MSPEGPEDTGTKKSTKGRIAAEAAVRGDNPYSDNAKTTATLRLTRHPVP